MYAPAISADQFRAAAMQKLASRGRNQYLAKIAYSQEMEKIALTGLLGTGLALGGRALSAVGLKGLGGRVQARGARRLLRSAVKQENKIKNLSATARPGVPRQYQTDQIAGMRRKADALRQRSAQAFSRAERDLTAAANRSGEGLRGTQYANRAADAQKGFGKATNLEAPEPPALKARNTSAPGSAAPPPPPPKAPDAATAGAPTPKVESPTPKVESPTPKPDAPPPKPDASPPEGGEVTDPVGKKKKKKKKQKDDGSVFGWDQQGKKKKLKEDASTLDRFDNWWGGLSSRQQRNNVMLGVGGALGTGAVGGAVLSGGGGGNRTTVVYR